MDTTVVETDMRYPTDSSLLECAPFDSHLMVAKTKISRLTHEYKCNRYFT